VLYSTSVSRNSNTEVEMSAPQSQRFEQQEENPVATFPGQVTRESAEPPSTINTSSSRPLFSTNASFQPRASNAKALQTPLSQAHSGPQNSQRSDPVTSTDDPKTQSPPDTTGESSRPIHPPPTPGTITSSNVSRTLHDPSDIQVGPPQPIVLAPTQEQVDEQVKESDDEYNEEPDTGYRTGDGAIRPLDFPFGPLTGRVASLFKFHSNYAGELYIPGFEKSAEASRCIDTDVARVDLLFGL